MFESTLDRWMNTPANPAVSSRVAGSRPMSSRLRDLMTKPPWGRGLVPEERSPGNPSQLQFADQLHGIRLRTKLVAKELLAPITRDERGRYPGDEERLVQGDPRRQVIGQAAVDGDDPLAVGAD